MGNSVTFYADIAGRVLKGVTEFSSFDILLHASCWLYLGCYYTYHGFAICTE